MMEIEKQITELKALLTGDLFQDGDLMQKIYELKKQLNPEIVDNPELDDDDLEECLYCGS
jgi:hypothetical protein